MKRVLLTLTGTVLGVVALLSFKTHQPMAAGSGGLPSAGLPTSSPSSSASTPSTSTGAPPDPAATRSTSSPSTSAVSVTGPAEQTRYGIVQVKVTVAGKKITHVSFVQLTAFDGHSQQINSQAAPILLQETLSAQSARIDTVSGATYTSEGYLQSLQGALDQAGIR